MSMTREEAIELKAAVGRLMYSDNKDTRDYNALIEFIDASLRPVSREQVEKAWRGEWQDMREAYNDVPKRRCSRCKSVFIGLDTPFCEVCGAPMTDEAVQMVMERLEALHGET